MVATILALKLGLADAPAITEDCGIRVWGQFDIKLVQKRQQAIEVDVSCEWKYGCVDELLQCWEPWRVLRAAMSVRPC
ncbi:hypothetical protein CERZMDRAFT_91395 [Cercospora zeae-maydis SCOH1-5]|uniref:Uncharacterized protein n=1 Tax=Cercospora zeae-maydis SCOH1-5 TaxID=717836 RepID=A0A6A6F4H6_9PEZI|nr:hypothetical protein CERZMDRAFT_91395 [Cercospora zeae-maydis SCOH1-5]